MTNAAPQLWDTSPRAIIAAAERGFLPPPHPFLAGALTAKRRPPAMLTGLLFTSVGAKPNLSTPSKLSPPIDQKWTARSRFGGEWKESQCAYPLPVPSDNCVTPLSVRRMKEKKPRFPRQRRLGPTRRVGSSPSKPVVLGQGWRHSGGAHPRQGPAIAGVRETRTARQH